MLRLDAEFVMTTNVADEMDRRVSGLLNRVPGYRGYRAKEDRRDADRRMRGHLVAVYSTQADRVERVARDLANQRRLAEISTVDDFARTLRHFIDRVRTATYGYGGLFSDRDVDEIALDQILKFDEGLLAGVEELNAPIGQLETALASGGDLATPARAGQQVVQALLARFELRSEVAETGKPAPTDSVLRVLEPIRAEVPHAAYNLREGEALAILGDDFLVDGRIDVDGRPFSFALLRLSGGKDEWLLVTAGPDQTLARLTVVSDAPAESETTIAGTTYMPQVPGSGDGTVSGVGGRSEPRAVRYALLTGATDPAARALTLDWGTERQVFAGRTVHPSDVEVFGRPSQRLN